MKQPLFHGVCTAMVTPFLENKVNYPLAKMLLKRQMDAGIKAVVLSGTTGEAPALSDDEKLKLIKCCKEYCGDGCTVIAGTGSNSTAHAVELSKSAQEAGADALLVVTPYYNKSTEEGLYAHYMAVAHSVSIPIILYNVPSRTGLDIPVSVCRRLSRIPNIVGIKEACSDIRKITRIKSVCSTGFSVWSGNDDLTVPAMSLGAEGVISVASNIYPEQMLMMTHYALNGEFEKAASLQRSLQEVIDLLFCEVNPIPVKAAMAQLGFDCGKCRLPLCPLTKENELKLKAFFS